MISKSKDTEDRPGYDPGTWFGLGAALVVLAFGGLPALWMVARDRDWRLALRLIGVTAAVSLPFLPIVLGYMAFAEAWRAEHGT